MYADIREYLKEIFKISGSVEIWILLFSMQDN